MELTREQLLAMHRSMVRIRLFEETAGKLMETGKMPGFLHLYVGQEAVAVGVCEALRVDDYITSTHRGHGHLVAKGGDLARMMAELMGKATGYCGGNENDQQCQIRTPPCPSQAEDRTDPALAHR